MTAWAEAARIIDLITGVPQMNIFRHKLSQAAPAILLTVFGLFAGCASSRGVGDLSPVVIEKSRMVAPKWTDQKSDYFIPGQFGYWDFTVVQEKRANLVLGIRQGRESAFYSGQLALANHITKRLEADPEINALMGHEFPMASLQSIVLRALENQREGMIEISDIYYEKLKGTDDLAADFATGQYFNIFVLVRVKVDKIREFTSAMKTDLQSRPEPHLKQLGELMSLSTIGFVSH